jgi:hypothetical protein
MGATCSLVFKQLELEYTKPVGMGIVGPGATAEQVGPEPKTQNPQSETLNPKP